MGFVSNVLSTDFGLLTFNKRIIQGNANIHYLQALFFPSAQVYQPDEQFAWVCAR